ncbi:hypothetical protein FJTKL_14886 [Diaporthe vaccinii]|uniref:Involucrin repeat protein n=1 Tax=Diaporthe vaccinii TaxID=105482 RepID=A0ABR4F8I5_9PEZI
MSERRRRWSPESSRRRRKAKRDSREQLVLDDPSSMAPDSRSMAPDSRSMAPATATESTFASSYSYAYPGAPQSQAPSSSFQYQTSHPPDQQPLPGGPGGPITMRSSDDPRTSAPMPMPGPSRGHDRERDRRRTRRSRHGSPSSSDALSVSSSSSSSYLEISRWYPSFGRSGGVLNAFFKTPSEHRQRVRRRRSLKKKNRGIFGFGNNSSSSSVNSDMAYGMGFVRKPKSRNFSPRGERAAGLEKSDARPAQAQRRQTDEEILEIGRQLAKVARDSNREDLRATGKRPPSQFSAAQDTWNKYSRQNSGAYAASSRGIAPSKHGRHSSSSSSDDEWESASEGEYSSDESNSGLAYGAAVDLGMSPAPKSSVSRQSTMLSARPPEDIRPPDRKSSAVDPRLFGPVNSLRGLINTPCGYDDRNSVYTIPGPAEQRYAGSAGTAESASIEARPMQTVYPVQTSDPSRVDAARASGSFVSSQPSFSALSREPSHSSRRPEPLPIQAPKPIAPVRSSMYDEQRIRDSEQTSPREYRVRPNENKTFAETALVGAGVAALGAAIMAGRDKGKGKDKEKERDPELRQGRHERYGHDDHREEGTVVQDSRRAKELALEKEIERLEKALADRSKAREQRKRYSKRDSATEPLESTAADVDAELDREKRRRDRDSRYSEPDYGYERPETSRRVSEPGERPASADSGQTRRAEIPAVPSSSGVDVFQFQVPDDAFRTRDSPLRAASPVIIDVAPAPSPPLEEEHRRSRRDSFEEEMRDAKHIYDESMHSTAPISAVDMAAAIAATERARHHEEPERGRTLHKTQDLVQDQANAYYHARRMAEREVSSRSRSKSKERSIVEKYAKDRDNESHGAEIVRIVTPPEMKQKPQKHKYSEPNADFRFDKMMSPKDLDHFRPHEYQVRDPSAERPRPYLNLVIPTPVPTPTPDSQKKTVSSRSPEPVVGESKKEEVPDVVISPRGEVVEAPQTPTSKRVSWGPSETQQYEVESPDRSSERISRSYERPRSPSRSSGWGATAAAVAGIAAAAALSKDDKSEPSTRDDRSRESEGAKTSEGSRSPPSRKVLPKGTAPSRVLDDEPEDVPPAPGPKPASPRSSQMPGAFADDLDFAATLAAGLQDTGFDPNIVIEDATYRRRDSPPGSNEHTGVYMQPYSETVTDLGVIDIDDGSRPARQSGYVIGELADTPATEKGSAFDWAEGSSRRQSKSEKRRSMGSDDIEVQGAKEESPKVSKKEQRKIEKAARAAKLAEEEDRSSQPADAGDEDWKEVSTSRKSKRSSKQSKRTSVGWDDADTPVNDRRVSVPVDAFDDLEDTKPVDDAWDEPQRTGKSKRDSKGYDLAEDPSGRRERRREERRRSDFYEPLDRDVTSVVSDTRHDDRSNGRGRHQNDDERSAVSAPDGKRDSKPDKRGSKEEKRSSGGFWGLLKGSNGVDGENQSKKDDAGTLGAGAGLAGAVAGAYVAAGSLASRSDAAEAPSEQEETQHVIVDVDHPSGRRPDSPSRGLDVFDYQDPEITPRVIKPAIDPQYGDLLPLPPSPSEEQKLDFDVSDDLPSLPDSRPATPPGQEKLLPREKRDSSQKRPAHSRRRSAYDVPLKSPSHTAIPIAFRMGQRSSIPSSPRVVSNPTSAHQSPAVDTQETFSSPSNKRSPRPPSWDRPTSWESTREIKPLYLIERSAHAGADSGGQEHDDSAENTPLPPSRESPAPESEDGGDVDKEARVLDSAPLFVDTAMARTVPLGSQESTPKGLTQTDSGLPDSAREFRTIPKETTGPSHIDSGLPRSAKDADVPLMEELHQSPLLESSYATPTGSPHLEAEARPLIQRDESTESISDFKDALDRPALEDTNKGQPQDISRGIEEEQPPYKAEPTSGEKQDKPGYFSSALSMLPAVGLVGVGALLGRGSRDDTAASKEDHPSQDTQESTAKSIGQPGEASVVPEFEASQAGTTASIDLGDQVQVPPTAGAGKSGPDTPLDTIEGADVSVPNDSPAAHRRHEGILPISDLQQVEDFSHDIKGPGPGQEAFVTDDTSVTLPPSSTQLPGNDLSTSPISHPEDMETIPETPVDTVEWPEESTTKKKKGKKGKKKQNSIGATSVPVTAESSARDSSHLQQDILSQEEPVSKAIEETSLVPPTTMTSSDQTPQESSATGVEHSPEQNFPKGGEPDISSEPYLILGESEGKGLTDDPEDVHDTIEASTIVSPLSQSQSQDDELQVGGRSRRSSSNARRLRSSRSSMSPHGSVDRHGSPDVFHSGDGGIVSPPSALASARGSTGQKYNKTRSLRSSRRSSLASQGSGLGNEPGLGETDAFDQTGSGFGGHQESHEVEQSSPIQQLGVRESLESLESPLEVVEQRVSSPLNVVEEHSYAQPEIRDESEVKAAGIVDEPASAQPELFTGDVQRIGSPVVEDTQRSIDLAESDFQELTPSTIDHTSPTSPQRAEEGRAEGLASGSLDKDQDVLGQSFSHSPLYAGDEAVQPPSEPVMEDQPSEKLPTDLAGGIPQRSEPEQAVHDDLQQKVESLPPVTSVEQFEQPFSSTSVVEPIQTLPIPSSPPHADRGLSELEQSTTEGVTEPALQEPSPILASMEEDDPFSTKKSKKNKKKRKGSTIIGGTVQSPGTTTPAELELGTQPAEPSVESSVRPSTSSEDDIRLERSSQTVKEPSLEPEQQPGSTEFGDLQHSSKSMEPEGDSSQSLEPVLPVSEDKSPIDSLQTTNPTVLPVLDDIPSEVPIPEVEKPDLGSQEKPGDILDEDEIARREAEAEQIRDEEAELSRLQSKKKLKPKEKTRLKQLKANIDRRADEAEAMAQTVSPIERDIPGAHIPDSSIQQRAVDESTLPVTEKPILAEEEASTGRSSLISESLPPNLISGSDEAVPGSTEIDSPSVEVTSQAQQVAGISPTSGDISPQLDESIQQKELQPEPEVVEDAEDLALREAEAALIRDEEAELARLESKKKPNKKDKVRMRVLRSNSERRAQEADAAAPPRIEEQDTADMDTPLPEVQEGSRSQFQGEDSTRDPVSQETRETRSSDPQSIEDAIQTSDEISASTHPHEDNRFSLSEGDSAATNIGESSQVQSQVQDSSQHQAVTSSGDAMAGTGPSQFEEGLAEQSERQVKLEGTQPDNSRPNSAQFDSAQMPQIRVEDTSSQLDPLPDEGHTMDVPQTQFRRDSLPQIEDAATDTVEMQPPKDNVDVPETQIEDLSQARDDGPSFEVQEDVVATGIRSEQASQAPAQEPVLVSDITEETDRGTNISSPFGGSEQPAVTVTELPEDPESEWPVMSKKSKKDKKKKRKGTISDGSGQNSGSPTPFFDASEQSPAVESRGLIDTVPGSSEDVAQPSSSEPMLVEQGQQASASLALDDDAAKDIKLGGTTAGQPLEGSIPEQQETSLSFRDSVPTPGISDDNIAKDLTEEDLVARPLESSVPEHQEASHRTGGDVPENSEEFVSASVPESEPDQVAFNEEPEFQPVSKKSKKDKKKKRKNTLSGDVSLSSGSATPIALDEPEQPSSLAETPVILEGGQPTLERFLPVDITKETAPIPSTIEETSATKSPVLETVQSAEVQPLPHSVSEEPSKSPTLGGIPRSIPEPEPEQLAQEDPGFFITKKSKKDKKRKKTLSGNITPMTEIGEASLPSEPAAIQERDLGSTQEPSSPPSQPSEPESSSSNDLVEDTPLPTEHADVLPPAHLPETEALHSTPPLDSQTEKPHVEPDQASRPGRKSDGWGFLAGAIAGAGVASTIPQSRGKSSERDVLPEDITAGHSPIQTVGTDTLASRPSLNFADVVQTATTSDFKDQERSQATNISRDQSQSLSFPVEESGQPDDVVQEPKSIQEDTSDVIAAAKESQEESASLSCDVVDLGPSSTQSPLEKDIKQEASLPSGHLVQEPTNFEEVAPDLQGSLREEQITTSEPQSQLDDWTQASSSKKKKKKDKKRKRSSTPWSEAESGAYTPITEEPGGARDFDIDTNERSISLDTGDLSRPQDSLAKQPELEPDLKATEERHSAPLAGDEFNEQASLEGVPQPGTTDTAKDAITTPKLHSTGGDRDDTFIATGDQALQNLGLGQIQKESHASEAISSPISDPKVDDRNEPLVTAAPLHEETLISPGQAQESSDRPSQENDDFTRDIGSASTEAFAMPMQLPTVTQEVDDQPLDLSVARDTDNDNAQIGTGLRSLDLEPESSTSVRQTPAEPADTPAEQSLETATEDLWEPIPKKLSKKEKRKAKKGSLSTNVPELTTSTHEGDSQQFSKELSPGALNISSQQTSPILGQRDEPVAQDVEKIDLDRSLEPENEPISMQPPEEQPSQAQETPAEETPVISRKISKKEKRKPKKASLSAWEDDMVEPVESSQSQTPITVEKQSQDITTTSSPILGPELGQTETTQTSGSAEPLLAEDVSKGMGPSTAKDATAEDEWATPISRKKSKKDKKKGKQSSSGSISGSQTPAVVEPPILHGVDAVESVGPVPERSGTPDQPTDVSQFEGHSDRRSSEINTSLRDSNAKGFDLSDQAIDDASASQGRKDHRSAELYLPLEGANDELLTGPSGEASTPSHRRGHRSAELYVPGGERNLEVQNEDDWDMPSDDQSKKDKKSSSSLADKTPTLRMPMEELHQIDKYQNETSRTDAQSSRFLRSPDGRGKELEKMQPSPDLWDDEDYFKPKPATFAEPNQEPFSKFDIHPAVARGLTTSPDRRVGEERPLVGLGLIHRHSSIFQEDEGHVPKLLTMTSDNVSTDSVAIQEAEAGPSGESPYLGSLIRSATVPERPGSSRSYDEGLSPAVKQVNHKQWFTFETGPAHGANVPLARSVSPDNLRPISPGLPRSPQFPPPKSAQLSPQFPPQPSPRSPQYSPRDSSSFEAARDPSKKGSVAALAEIFGGAKKATGQGAVATSHGREPTTPGSDNVSEPRSQPDIDAGTFTPQIPDQASREAEIPLESVVVESPVLGSQASVDFPTDEQQPLVKSPRELPEASPDLPGSSEDANLHEVLYQPQDSPTPPSRSPVLEKISSIEDPTPTIETGDDDEPAAGPSVIDFSRSLPTGLPSVQEEPHEEEAESSRHVVPARPRAVTPDFNRDSGVVTGSPVPLRVHQFESAQQQRDSGVHMRDPSGASPRLLGTRAFSPQPARLSHSSIEDEGEGANLDDKSPKRSSTAESEAQRRFREATPVLEAHDAPVTPEPRKNTSKSRKYPDLGPSPGKKAAAASLAGGGALLAAGAARSLSRSPSPSPSPAASQRSVSDVTDELRASALPRQRRAASSNTGISRARTPEPLSLRAESPSLLRHSGTPPLRSRRSRSGDLRSLSQLSNRSHSDLGAQASGSPASAASAASAANKAAAPTPASSDLRRATTPAVAVAQGTNIAPTANEGRVRSKDMADVYDGVGEGRLGSPRSPTRPHSMRRRQSMQVLELESRVEQLIAENRALQDARTQAEAHTTNRATSTLAERDTEIEALKQSLDFMRKEVQRLTEVNEGLNSAIQQHAVQHDDRYRLLENQHAEATRELLEHRDRHDSHSQTIEEKDQEIKSLREQLEATKEQIREMQKQILATKPADSDFLRIKDVDYFDHRCQQLCSHVQQWVLRFSKFSDMRACRLTTELNDEKIIDRLDNAVLDGSNVDHYLNDRVRRRDVFMSVTMTMIWEFVFTRYLFGMDREQRQKLKNLEKLLLEVGPPQAVRQWRAVTLTLLSKREPFKDQRDQDTEAVVQAVFQTLSMILPPPSNLEDQIQGQLRKVMREAVDLSVEMRTQRAEYMMLPPLQPDYDANGDLAEPHPFNSALMNERSGDKNATTDNDELEAQGAVVRVVLFPLVVKKGDDDGVGDDEIVVCPAQVIVAKPRSKSRHSYRAPSSDAGGVSLLRGGSPSTAPNRSNVSMTDAPGMAPGMEGAI